MDATKLVTQLAEQLLRKDEKIVTAESCTGGMIAAAITSLPGSSKWFERGFVTYSNRSKTEMLVVQSDTLEQLGAVSEAVAIQMAEGALQQSHAHYSLAVTGVAGPDGGTSEKPVGTVWFAWAGRDKKTKAVKKHFEGNRSEVREQSAIFALAEMSNFIAF